MTDGQTDGRSDGQTVGQNLSWLGQRSAASYADALSKMYDMFVFAFLCQLRVIEFMPYIHCVSIKRDPDIIDCNFNED